MTVSPEVRPPSAPGFKRRGCLHPPHSPTHGPRPTVRSRRAPASDSRRAGAVVTATSTPENGMFDMQLRCVDPLDGTADYRHCGIRGARRRGWSARQSGTFGDRGVCSDGRWVPSVALGRCSNPHRFPRAPATPWPSEPGFLSVGPTKSDPPRSYRPLAKNRIRPEEEHGSW